MKKIYTLLAALFVFATTAMADNLITDEQSFVVSENKVASLADLNTGYYVMRVNCLNEDGNSIYQDQTDGTFKREGQKVAHTTITNPNLVYITAGEIADNKRTVTIKGYNGQYLAAVSTSGNTPGDTGFVFNAEETTSGGVAFYFKNPEGGDSPFLNCASGGMLRWTGGAGDWSKYTLYPATITSGIPERDYTLSAYTVPEGATITYSLDGKTMTADGTTTTTVTGTKDVSDLTVTGTPEGYTYTVTLSGSTFIVDFVPNVIEKTARISEERATTVETDKWYLLLQTRGGDSYVYDANGTYNMGDVANMPSGTLLTEGNRSYLFRFIATDDGKYFIQNANGKFFPQLTGNTNLAASATPSPYTVALTSEDNGGFFYMQSNDGVIVDNNGRGSTVVGWGSTVPTGTTGNNVWQLYPVTFPTGLNLTAYNAALAKAKSYEGLIGTGLGKYSNEAGTTEEELEAVIAANGNMGEGNTQDEVDAATDKLTAAVAGFTLNMPADGTYLRLKSASTQAYVISPDANGGESLSVETGTSTVAPSIWYFQKEDNGKNGGLLSYNSGKYITSKGDNPLFLNTSIVTTAKGLVIAPNPNYLGTYVIYNRNGGWWYLKSQTEGENITLSALKGNADLTDVGFAWNLEEVTELPVAMHEAGDGKYYATLYLPKAVNVSGATAYKVTSKDVAENRVKLTSIDDNVVVAQEPVVLIGSSDAVTATVTTVDGTASTDNLLQGVATATQMNETNYYFGQSDNVPGFYKTTSTSYITNKAYLPGTAEDGSAKGYVFDFGTSTGLDQLVGNVDLDSNAPRYNLAGQRVTKSYKGVVIVNGQKRVQK